MARRYAIIEAPSILGLRPNGVQDLPEALLHHGLAEGIAARRAARLEVPPYDPQRDAGTLTLNAQAIADWSPKLADAVGDVIDAGEFPVVLGGDCSILLGNALALRRRGRFGLFFIDGHADFYQPEANPNGEAASMDLAFATGHGPALLTDIEGLRPLVRPEDTVAFAFRDAAEQAQYGSQPLAPEILALDLAAVRRLGAAEAAQQAMRHLTRPGLDGFFVHCDADCLDDAIMPAVEYRLPDGLHWEELRQVLQIAIGSGRAAGLQVTVYNPRLDPDGAAGRGLARTLIAALGTAAPTV